MACVKHLIRGSTYGPADEHHGRLPVFTCYSASDGDVQRFWSYVHAMDDSWVVHEYSWPEGTLDDSDAQRIAELVADALYVHMLVVGGPNDQMELGLRMD